MSNYKSTLQSNNTGLQAILNTINELPEAGGEQATPIISISSNGLITATAGTKTSTHQLAFQAAKTITPSTTSQIAVSSGYYTGGNITVAGDSNLVANNIVSGKTIFGVAGTATAGDDPFASASPFAYTVNAISGARYGFTKNSNGYYESQNKGQHNSYAICRVNLTVTKTCDITFDVINYAEGGYDYALFGDLNKALLLSNTADSSNVKKSFKGQQSASIVNVTYGGVTAGSHYIDIKFIKDRSQHSNNDSVQFKLQEQGSLSQETINKILAADGDLVAENIKSGVDIFGVVGTYEGSGGDTSIEDSLVTGTISNYTNNRVVNIGDYAFANCSELTTVSFPVATSIGRYAFAYCSALTTASFPKVTSIGNYAFMSCAALTTVSFPKATSIGINAFASCSELTTVSFPMATSINSYAFANCAALTTVSFPKVTSISNHTFYSCSELTTVSFPKATSIGNYAFMSCAALTTVSFPKVTSIGNSAFSGCTSLTTVSFPNATNIGVYAFYSCYNLKSLYLTGSSVCKLLASNAFSSTPIGGYSATARTYGSIYVPTSLLTSYKTATNWTYFSSRFVGV